MAIQRHNLVALSALQLVTGHNDPNEYYRNEVARVADTAPMVNPWKDIVTAAGWREVRHVYTRKQG